MHFVYFQNTGGGLTHFDYNHMGEVERIRNFFGAGVSVDYVFARQVGHISNIFEIRHVNNDTVTLHDAPVQAQSETELMFIITTVLSETAITMRLMAWGNCTPSIGITDT